MNELGRVLRIRTPEGVTFSYALAGPLARALALVIDFVCATALAGIVSQLANTLRILSTDLAVGLAGVLLFVFPIFYGVVLEWFWRGQTVGKRMLHLRVVDASGFRLQFHQVLFRNLLRFVDMLPGFYLLGGLVCFLNGRSQRLGDMAAATAVIYQPPALEPDLEQLMAGKFNSLGEHPHLAARLRQAVAPELASLALQAILRRDQLAADARVALFADLANHFKTLVRFPPECVDSLADEQYIRNVAAVLFARSTPFKPRSAFSVRDSF